MFLSGYSKEYSQKENNVPDYDWDFLAKNPITLVFYMGFYNLQKICKTLMQHGKPKDTRIAVITNSSLPNNKKAVGTLENIKMLVDQHQLTFPAIVIIGNTIHFPQEEHHPEMKIPTPPPTAKKRHIGFISWRTNLQGSDLLKNFANDIQEEMSFFQCAYGFLTESFHPTTKKQWSF